MSEKRNGRRLTPPQGKSGKPCGRSAVMPRLWAMVAALVVAVGLMVFAQQCSHRRQAPFGNGAQHKSGGDTLDVAIEISPVAYSLAGDTVSGLDYDIINDLSRLHHRPVKFHPFAPLSYALDGLENGNFDMVVSSLPATSQLKQELLLTDRVYLDREVLVQRKDAARFIATPEALAGDTVWIASGSPFRERLANLSAEIGDTIYIEQNLNYTAEHLVMLIAAGEIERAVINEGIAREMQGMYDNIDVSTPVSFTQFQVWALRGDNHALCDSVNAWLKAYRGTERYRQLLERYHKK
jgi:ABC-type amino acid transport substrate-binding protein